MGDEEQDLREQLATILDGMGEYYDYDGNPISALDWFDLSESPDARVGLTRIGRLKRRRRTRCRVSTVWLGQAAPRWGDGPPLIYETMVFGGLLDGHRWRYATRVEAAATHILIADAVRLQASDKPRVKREKAPRRAYKYNKGKAYAFA